jgi:hypothetical protein
MRWSIISYLTQELIPQNVNAEKQRLGSSRTIVEIFSVPPGHAGLRG